MDKHGVNVRNGEERVGGVFSSHHSRFAGSLLVGHTRCHVGDRTTKLGSRQRDLPTSSVTKRANGHWHADFA